jgi:tetratricopeptide (TPR) repeat protein
MEYETAPATTAREQPTEDRQHLLCAGRLFAEGQYEPALRSFSRALDIDKTLPEGWAGQVRCLLRLGEVREAQVWATKACHLFPGVPLLHSARARALAATGLVAEALGESDAALEQVPDEHACWVWLDRAAVLLADGRRSTASHCLDKVRLLSAGDADWAQHVAIELLDHGDSTGSLEGLQDVVERRPRRAYSWLLLARAARLGGRRSQAEAALSTAERLDLTHPALEAERLLIRRPTWVPNLGGPVSVTREPQFQGQRWVPWIGGGPLGHWMGLVMQVMALRPLLAGSIQHALDGLGRIMNRRLFHGKAERHRDQHSSERHGGSPCEGATGQTMPQSA